MTHVWSVEHCDYDSFITGMFATAEDALAGIRALYDADPEYKVVWHPPVQHDPDLWTISADYECVAGKSTKHSATWEVKRWEVQGNP